LKVASWNGGSTSSVKNFSQILECSVAILEESCLLNLKILIVLSEGIRLVAAYYKCKLPGGMRGSLVEQYNPTLESCKEMDPLILLTQVL
jgi:hypothetical protein